MYFRIWFRFCEVSLSSVMPIAHHIKIIIITFFIVICLLKWELAYPGLHRPLWRKKNFGQKIIHCFLRMTKTNPIKNWNFFICKLRKWHVYFQFRVCYIESKVKKIFETILAHSIFSFIVISSHNSLKLWMKTDTFLPAKISYWLHRGAWLRGMMHMHTASLKPYL